jgi:hypothetical protein
MTNSIFAEAGDFIELYCYSAGNTGATNLFDSALTAVLINSSDANKKGNKQTHTSGAPGAPVELKLKSKSKYAWGFLLLIYSNLAPSIGSGVGAFLFA